MMPTTPASAARERSGHIHVEQRGWTLAGAAEIWQSQDAGDPRHT